MPGNRYFWIFPNDITIQGVYDVRQLTSYQRGNLITGIQNLFNTGIRGVNESAASVHVNRHYEDDPAHHALDVALGLMEGTLTSLSQTGAPPQGRGTGIHIGNLTVYHETGTYRRRNFDGICTLFYTFDQTTRMVVIHAIGAHGNEGYYLDCASSAFDMAVRNLRNGRWGYRERGIIHL